MPDAPLKEQSTSANDIRIRFFQWVLLGGVALFVLGLVFVHAPQRVKLLGIFSIAYGAAAGGILAYLAKSFRIHFPTTAFVTAYLLIVVGLIGSTFHSWQIYASDLEERYAVDPTAMFLSKADGEQRLQLQQLIEDQRQDRERQLAQLTSFSAYLRQRVAALGDWPAIAATAFWIVELLLAGLVGGWIVQRAVRARYCTACQNWYQDQKSFEIDGDTARRIVDTLSIELENDMPVESLTAAHVSIQGCRCLDRAPVLSIEFFGDRRQSRANFIVSPDTATMAQFESLLKPAESVQ